MHNTCEDSLLAVPLIIDLAVLCEVCERIKVRPHPACVYASLSFFFFSFVRLHCNHES
jgi:myo-inositol-1-phosphate synthase